MFLSRCLLACLALVSTLILAEDKTLLIEPPPPVTAAGTGAGTAGSRAIVWDHGDPTAAEQYVLEMINRARANPTAEGTRLGIDIKEGLQNPQLVGVRPPLAMNKTLLAVARAHSQDMHANNFFAHNSLSGATPFQRMTAAGYTFTTAGENIATGGNHTAAALEDLLMIDANVTNRGHRVNLLDIKSSNYFREVGIGMFSGTTANGSRYKDFLTQDFGSSSTGPFLVGVVYNDLNGNGFYDIGEGIGGVTITPDSGTHSAVTSTSGGYAFPVATSGTINVTASGGSLPVAVNVQVTLTGSNVKQDFTTSGAPGGDGPGVDPGSPGSGDTFVSHSDTDSDGDGFPDEIEAAMGTQSTSATSTPFGGSAAGAPQTLAVTKIGSKLNFAKALSDSISISGTLQVPDNFVVAGQTVIVDIGGVVKTFVLDAKGAAGKGTADTFALRVKAKKGAVAAQTSTFKAKFSKADFAATLADEGMLGAADVKSAPRTLPVIVIFNGQMYKVAQAVVYTAKTGKTGSAK